ncbi:DNA polymerase kappa-like [Diadema antillarum]|uniref:DNA polymerase kappa-like n=1 Tax=Diadema antillarum TaxID=105358 RepID=UPI003A8B87B1
MEAGEVGSILAATMAERGDEGEDEEDEDWMHPVSFPPGLSMPTRSDALMAQMPLQGCAQGADGGMSKPPEDRLPSMELNTHKAGMEGLDKEKINKIIMEASKGSKFYENQKKRDQQNSERVARMMAKLATLTDAEKKAALRQADQSVMELEASRDLSRTIVHLDMDMFYAAVEMRDDPSLKEKPMAVGGMDMLSTSNYKARRFGVRAAMPGFIGKKLCPELVIVPQHFDKYKAVSYEVREILAEYDPNFAPMSLDEAYFDLTEYLGQRQTMRIEERTFPYRRPDSCDQDCVDLRKDLVTGDHNSIHEFQNKTDDGEMTALPAETDEETVGDGSCQQELQRTTPLDAFHSSNKSLVSVKDNKGMSSGKEGPGDAAEEGQQSSEEQKYETFGLTAEEVVREIRFRIEQKTQLTASAGIAPNCMLAKVCSDRNKPNGQYTIQPTREAVMDFIKDLPIRKISGIGKVTERMVSALGIQTCTDLYQQRALLHLLFSSISSHHFLRVSLGLGASHIENDGERKSISTERTFREISVPSDLYNKCWELCEALDRDLKRKHIMGKTVTIKLKKVNFEVKTRASSLKSPVGSAKEIFPVAKELLKTEIKACHPQPLRLRLMGVRLSSLQDASKESRSRQGTLLDLFSKKQNLKNSSQTTITKDLSDKNTSTAVDGNDDDDDDDNALPTHEMIGGCSSLVLQAKEGHSDSSNGAKDSRRQDSSDSDDALSHAPCSTVDGKTSEEQQLLTSQIPTQSESRECHTSKSPEHENSTRTSDVSQSQRHHIDGDSSEHLAETNGKAYDTGIETECVAAKQISEHHPGRVADFVSEVDQNLTPMQSFVCPICGMTKEYPSLVAFNHHIDVCLSNSAIKEILQKDHTATPSSSSSFHHKPSRPSPQKKSAQKRTLPTSSSSNKKRKSEPHHSRTLHHFFQQHPKNQ